MLQFLYEFDYDSGCEGDLLKRVILMATAYPYTAGIIAVMWVGSVILLKADPSLSIKFVVTTDVVLTALFASIGFKR